MTPARPVPRVRTLECPGCGGTIELRGHAHTLNAVCVQCLSILDASTPDLQILQKFQAAQRFLPLIPLGKRGRLFGAEYEAIGFQMRQIEVEGVAYRWAEYLLYNPYRGYVYLTEYQGHWNAIRTLRALPRMTSAGGRSAAEFGGRIYKHFQKAHATTIYVMGEFPWQVRVGEQAQVDDYVAPPFVLSAETTSDEVVWSSGVYLPGKDVWAAFGLPGAPPAAQGVYANQPSPYAGRIGTAWTTFLSLAAVWVLLLASLLALGRGREVFRQKYAFNGNAPGEHAFVTPVFELNGRTSTAEVRIHTDLSNDWAGFSLALINDDTGVAYNRAKEISYYFGRDSDGNWTEGSPDGSTEFPAVPPGRYYLRVEPDMEDDGRPHMVNYEIVVRYGSFGVGWLLLAFPFLLIPPVYTTIRAMSFENARWSESDYGPMFGGSSSSEDDD